MSVVVTIVASIIAFSASVGAQASIRRTTAIPPQALAPALHTLVKEREFQIIYSSELLADRRTQGASGQFTMDEALTRLLSETGLTYQYLDDDTVSIVPVGSQPATLGKMEIAHQEEMAPGVHNELFWEQTRLAQADPSPGSAEGGQREEDALPGSGKESARESGQGRDTLEFVVVTARKKSERLQDVPMPVSVINTDDLVKSNKTRLEDYFSQIPGLTIAGGTVSIRGLSLGGFSNPTVGITIDDASTGSSTFAGGAVFLPEIDPAELESVEVLRGPQGALYGAASPGGLIRYVTSDPSTEALTGRVRVGANGIKNGSQTGYGVNGSINVPLSDTLAMRASGFKRRDPGYIDNPVRGVKGLNETRAYGGSVATLWAPSDAFSVKLSATYQDSEIGGDEDVFPALGLFMQNKLTGAGLTASKYQAYSARVRAKLGAATLTSVTGYNVSDTYNLFDSTPDYQTLVDATEEIFGIPNGTTGVTTPGTFYTTKLTQELRLEVPLGPRVDWLIAGFYGRERSTSDTDIKAVQPDTAEVVGDWGHLVSRTPYTDSAVFTDFTVRLTERFDVQAGGRYSRIEQAYSEVDTGPFVPITQEVPSPSSPPSTHDRSNAFTYSLTPRLKVSPNLMTYVRLASGYSPGGSNPGAETTGVPKSYKPSTTQNYELGMKGEALDSRLSFDISLYYIDWKDLPVSLVQVNPDNGQRNTYTGNAGGALSHGVEVSVQMLAAEGLTIGGWVTFSDAHLTTDFPGAFASGKRGDPLPDSSRRSANFSVDQEFALGAERTGSVGGTLSYVGRRAGSFSEGDAAKELYAGYGGYTMIDLRAGLDFDPWSIDMYANNVTDKRALTGRDLVNFAFNYITPRTVGFSVSRRF